jgi:hypothetical protein
MDMENLSAAPNIDNFDPSKMDRGDSIEPPAAAEPVKDEEVEKIVDETLKAEEPKAEEPKAEEETPPAEEDKARDEKGRFEAKIPKARFDAVISKEREAREAAERRADELERQLKAGEQAVVRTQEVEAIEANISALEEKHADLLLDGKSKEAAAVMKEIRHAERQIARAEADAMANQRISQTMEAQKFDTVVARIEADHPQLNPESELYDADLVELVLSKQQSLMRTQGMSPSQAMDKASKDVAERFLKVEEPAKEDAKGLAAAKAVEDRKAQQLSKNLDTMKKQPASMKESGIDSDKAGQTSQLDVMSMSREDFDALPETTKAKLRGDYV